MLHSLSTIQQSVPMREPYPLVFAGRATALQAVFCPPRFPPISSKNRLRMTVLLSCIISGGYSGLAVQVTVYMPVMRRVRWVRELQRCKCIEMKDELRYWSGTGRQFCDHARNYLHNDWPFWVLFWNGHFQFAAHATSLCGSLGYEPVFRARLVSSASGRIPTVIYHEHRQCF